jgi:RNA polymerase sigma-70 factor (family 1)
MLADTEKKLLEQVAIGSSEKAFRQLFDIYYDPLVHYASYIIGNSSLAEEIVSEVFISLWKNRSKLTEIHELKKYLYTSTKNKAIDYIRHAKSLSFISLNKMEFKECIEFETPEDKCIEKEIRTKLGDTILKLPEKCRMVYQLVKEEQMKYQEVAELLDISPKTVENQMIIAMKRIREEIAMYFSDEERKSKTKFLGFFL